MKNMIIFLVIFLIIGVLGLYYYLTADGKLKEMGFQDARGIVISFTEPVQRSKSTSTVDWYKVVRFTHEGKEQTVSMHANGYQDPAEIGKEVNILVNTQDLQKSQLGSFQVMKKSYFMMLLIGFIGAAGWIIALIFRR